MRVEAADWRERSKVVEPLESQATLEAIRLAVRESRYVVSPEVVAESMLSSLVRFPEGI
jgi:hypothetical protein